jgi:sulfatase modifying factor 1
MLLQNYLHASRSLAKLDSLRPLCEKVVNEIYLSKLVELASDPDLPADLIYSAALNFVAPRNPLISVQGGTLPKNSELAGQKVADFEIGQYPVTLEEWQGVHKWALENGFDMAEGTGDGPTHPVVFISWYDCVKWCNAKSLMEGLQTIYRVKGENDCFRAGDFDSDESQNIVRYTGNGYRLPTEAEWEWAARGGCQSQNYKYAGSNNLNAVGWYIKNSGGATHAVGEKSANELGLFDMSGNVLEWCWNLDPANHRIRRFRGGCWDNDDIHCAVSWQYGCTPDNRDSGYGLRIARSL